MASTDNQQTQETAISKPFSHKNTTAEGIMVNEDIETKGKPASLEKVTAEDEAGMEEGKIGKYEFMVGDLVWGKIKSHPWWPGQIYDPSHASEYALTAKHEGPLLVAYFGDGTFAWCVLSQLIPFTQHFNEMSRQSANKRFLNAVNTALDELARRAELKLKLGVGLSEPEPAINAGVRAGVFVPEGDYERLGVPTYEHSEMLEYVKRLARGGSIASSIDLVVIKSWVSVFHRGTGGSDEVEGIEDMSDDVVIEKEEARPVLGPWKLKRSEKQKSESNEKVATRKRKRINGEDTSGKKSRPKKPEIGSPFRADEPVDSEDETLSSFRVGSIKVEIHKLTKIIKKCEGRERESRE